MLNTLTTKNFRKLKDRTFEFGPGLQAVRGPNEEGKSTMLEAFGYLIGGVKACRDALEEVVSWGEPLKSLSVEGTLTFDGVQYHGKRSKSGAEIRYSGGVKPDVTGQNECTDFWARLIGCSPDMMPRLMVAPQGAIRGALGEKGQKPVIELIESLADFEIIDMIIELIQTHMVTGPTTLAEDRVKRAQEASDAAAALVVAPDTAGAQADLAARSTELSALVAEVEQTIKPSYDAAEAALTAATASFQEGTTVQQHLTRVIAARKSQDEQRDDAQVAALALPDPHDLTDLQAKLEGAKTVQVRLAAYDRVQKLMAGYPEACWDEDAAALQRAIEAAAVAAAAAAGAVVTNTAAITALEAELQSGEGACRSCGQTLPNAAAVAAHNAAIQAKITAAKALQPVLAAEKQTADADLAELRAVQTSAGPFDLLARELGAYIDVDLNFVPPKLAWRGEKPSLAIDVTATEAEIDNHKRKTQLAVSAAAKVDVLTQAIAEANVEVEKLQHDLAQCVCADLVAIKQMAFDQINAAYQAKSGRISECRFDIDKLQTAVNTAAAAYAVQLATAAKAKEALTTATKDLTDLEFNNALLKRVRLARPVIADKLWSIVLASVSSYFSAMRGMKSVITRAGSEFLCDGKKIGGGGLSGSALDLLGVAIRWALVRTFLPTSPMMILDEPTSAMDEPRTQSFLGFLVAADFPQTLMITHNELAESVAQNVVTI